MSDRRPYRSDLSDERWALIEPVVTSWKAQHPSVSGHQGDARRMTGGEPTLGAVLARLEEREQEVVAEAEAARERIAEPAAQPER